MILVKQEDIDNIWEDLLPGFQKVLEYTTGDESLEEIKKSLKLGFLRCWIWPGTEGRKIDGFSTAHISQPIPGQTYFVIDHSWVHPDVQPLTITAKTHEFLEGYARKLDCNKIKVYSLRDIGRWMNHYGFTPTYVEYEKEL